MTTLKEDKKWYAIRTRNRSEKWVVKQLTELGVEAWIPLKWSVKKYPGRTRKTQVPLIHGYAFVFIPKSDNVLVLEVDGVFNFVRFGNNIPAVPAGQIELLKHITGENIHVEMTDSLMDKGDQVEIIAGELTGLVGELVEFKGKHRVLIRLENIGLSFLFEVPRTKLRKKE